MGRALRWEAGLVGIVGLVVVWALATAGFVVGPEQIFDMSLVDEVYARGP
ncbi:hypothetical protein [Gordonia paraffinivorans]